MMWPSAQLYEQVYTGSTNNKHPSCSKKKRLHYLWYIFQTVTDFNFFCVTDRLRRKFATKTMIKVSTTAKRCRYTTVWNTTFEKIAPTYAHQRAWLKTRYLCGLDLTGSAQTQLWWSCKFRNTSWLIAFIPVSNSRKNSQENVAVIVRNKVSPFYEPQCTYSSLFTIHNGGTWIINQIRNSRTSGNPDKRLK